MLESEQKVFHEQKTIKDAHFSKPEQEERPAWPPPPRPRPRQGPPRAVKILVGVLAGLLVAGGLGFVIYTTNDQYGQALVASRGLNANATVRSELQRQATVVSSLAQTAQPLATAQARIVASATAQALPTVTAQAQSDQATVTATTMEAQLTQDTSGTPDLDDPLTDNSLGNQWDTIYADNNASGCNFINSEYEVQEVRQDFLQTCFADATNFSQFVYQVTLTINSGSEGGLIFRANQSRSQYYLFRIDVNGTYALDLYNGSSYTLLTSGTSDAIETGTGESNDLVVIADQSAISLFVNENYIDGVTSHTLTSGEIGVAAVDTNLPAAVDFSNAEVWKLS